MQYMAVLLEDDTTTGGCSQQLDQPNSKRPIDDFEDDDDTSTDYCHGHDGKSSKFQNPRPNVVHLYIRFVIAGILWMAFCVTISWRLERRPHTTIPHDGYFRYNKIIGHLHMAKTAGTEINGELAAHYERVCGNKGYSYDSFQANERLREETASNERGNVTTKLESSDIYSERYPGHNRGRVPGQIMNEIGFEDCDYISLERPWETWINITRMWPLELHVPCRDPLQHLMSQCNHHHLVFNCEAPNLRNEVRKCLTRMERFSNDLVQMPNVTLKCFNPIPIQPYLKYMDKFLERKRLETNYVHRDTNVPRNKENECIWNNSAVAGRVLDILYEYEYYQWCKDCMGSDNDILGHLEQ